MSVEKQLAAVKLEIEQLNAEIAKYEEMELDSFANIEMDKLANKSCQPEIFTAKIKLKHCETDRLKKITNGSLKYMISTYQNGKILQVQINNVYKNKSKFITNGFYDFKQFPFKKIKLSTDDPPDLL